MKISMALILHLLEIRIWTQVFDSKHLHNNGEKTYVQVNIGVCSMFLSLRVNTVIFTFYICLFCVI